ncbi:MAG: alpha/beta hydrolase [Burkholderiales bacterium]|nr:alpha/beta hydrolase [Burkholderiales bacterium]
MQHEWASPLLQKSFEGLPSATIINAQHDPLSDHGKMYAHRLRDANIPVTHSVYSKAVHGFFGSDLGESREAMAELVFALNRAFGSA